MPTVSDLLVSQRKKGTVAEQIRRAEKGLNQQGMQHEQAQQHGAKRLPYHAKQAGLGWLSGVPGYIGDMLNLVQGAADVIPGLGPLRNREPVGGTTESIGDMLGADTSSAAFQLGSIGSPDLNDVTRLGAMLAPITWHGSPHLFAPTAKNPLGEFDSTKIGTGEGAQAYGHGLYLADAKGVAKEYGAGAAWKGTNITSLPDEAWDEIGEIMRKHDIPGDMLIGVDDAANVRMMMTEFGGLLSDAEKGVMAKWAGWPNLYKVYLPDEMIPRMLDWDAPLSEQPESVKRALEPLIKQASKSYPSLRDMPPIDRNDMRAGDFYRLYADHRGGNQQAASKALAELGIPGIKYFDGNSRSAGKGTRNYVVFPGEEKNLKILERE